MTTEEFDNTNNRSLSASSSELLYKFLQTQNFEVYAALSQISKLSHTMFSKGDSWIQVPNLNVTFGQWDLAFLAKSLLLYATQNGSASLMGIPFAQCLKLINDIPDPITGQPREVQNRTFSALFRIGYNQFTWQEDLRYWIARTLYLFDIIPTEDFAHEPFDVIQRFLFMSGLTPRDFITVGFSVWAASTHMNLDYFSPKVFPMGSNFSGTKYGKLPNYLTHRNVQSFLEDVSIDREAFEQKSVQTHLEMDSAFDRYQWNPLYSQPLIRIPGGESLLTTSYVLPIPVLLLERITNGIYWDLMNQELGDQDQAFARLFGSIFENYVGRLLKYHFGNDSVIPEIQIGNRSCDWILVEGDSAVLFECKTKRLTLQSRISGDLQVIQTDMAKGAAKGLCTIARTRKELANGDLPSDGLGGVVNFYHVIIFVDPYYWANSPWARKLVEQAIAEDMVGNCTSLDVQNILYHVMSIQELETFLPTLKETGLAALIKTKETTENDYHSDFRGFFSKHLGSNLNNEMLSSVLDNFINEHGPHNDGGN